MPYLVASMIAIVSAMVILFSRYEADDSLIKSEIEKMKNMYSLVDSYVNVYIQSGGNLLDINFQELNDSGILPANSTVTTGTTDKESKMTFISSNVDWQMISTENSSYKLLIDMTKNSSLMSKAVFSESFTGKEFCEKLLFGDFDTLQNSYNTTSEDFENSSGSKTDGKYLCIIYK